jgi:hypothetical protein
MPVRKAKRYDFKNLGLTVMVEPGGVGETVSTLFKADDNDETNAAFSALESLILACACEGIDIGSKKFRSAIATAHDAIINNLEGN